MVDCEYYLNFSIFLKGGCSLIYNFFFIRIIERRMQFKLQFFFLFTNTEEELWSDLFKTFEITFLY